jgi:pimeloyl-ACP methyl ester carboxylesterase
LEYFSSRGLRLAYRMEGAGRPILLVHGFASTHRVNWIATGWSRALGEAGYRVIMPDGVGHGESDKPHEREAYALPAMAGDAMALLDHLGEARVDMMGYSMGAMISLIAAIEHGGRLGHVIAAGVGGTLLKPERDSKAVTEALLTDDPTSIKNESAALFRRFADLNKQDRKALALCFSKVREPFPVDGLSRITNPVLIIAGETDVSAGDPQDLAALIPGARAFVVPKRDHMKTVGDPQYKKAVLEFLSADYSAQSPDAGPHR